MKAVRLHGYHQQPVVEDVPEPVVKGPLGRPDFSPRLHETSLAEGGTRPQTDPSPVGSRKEL